MQSGARRPTKRSSGFVRTLSRAGGTRRCKDGSGHHAGQCITAGNAQHTQKLNMSRIAIGGTGITSVPVTRTMWASLSYPIDIAMRRRKRSLKWKAAMRHLRNSTPASLSVICYDAAISVIGSSRTAVHLSGSLEEYVRRQKVLGSAVSRLPLMAKTSDRLFHCSTQSGRSRVPGRYPIATAASGTPVT